MLHTDVWFSAPYDPATSKGQPHPPIHKFRCIWDTGATGCVINRKIVTALGLVPTGRITTYTVGKDGQDHSHETNTYVVNLVLPNQVGFIGVQVSEGEIGAFDALIGMDVIARGDFAVTHQDSKTCFTFRVPSCEVIDFQIEKERNERNRQKSNRKKGR